MTCRLRLVETKRQALAALEEQVTAKEIIPLLPMQVVLTSA